MVCGRRFSLVSHRSGSDESDLHRIDRSRGPLLPQPFAFTIPFFGGFEGFGVKESLDLVLELLVSEFATGVAVPERFERVAAIGPR